MIKKFTLHLDAVIVIVLLFVVSLGFNWYQFKESQDLFQQNVDANWEIQDLKTNLMYLKSEYEKCRSRS